MLLQNKSFLTSNALRYFAGAPAVSGVIVRPLLGGAISTKGNKYIGEATVYKGDGTPTGYSPMYAWYPNRTVGGMGSRYTVTGAAGMGLSKIYAGRSMPANISCSSSVSAVGSLVYLEDMEAAITSSAILTSTGNLLVDALCISGILGAGSMTSTLLGDLDGASDITASGDITAALGALGGMVSDMVGLASVSGAPYATGTMDAAILSYSTLSPENMAASVWNSVIADFQNTGTTGKALSSASSSGDPWSGIMSNYTDDATFGAFVKKLLTASKFIGLK